MILLKRSLATALAAGGTQAVMDALQQAIELEHSTIPIYLYALYSLDKKLNGDIADIIQSVAVEEMLHLTLAANVLSALGGTPILDDPKFIPTYPGALPGGVDTEQVHLAPFSMTQLDSFLKIEQPEEPIDIPKAMFAMAVAGTESNDNPITIGQYYRQLIAEIGKLDDSAFSIAPRNQIGPDLMDESVVVTSKDTAVQALNIIIDQGEGTAISPKDMEGDYAHFYRYQQIVKGKKLIPAPGKTPPWVFGGDPIILNPKGVYSVPVDPSAKDYTQAQTRANKAFNYTYTSLLKSLHATLNGQPDQLTAAIGLMMSLKQQGKDMMSGGPDGRTFTGPTFEYQPTLT